MNDLREEVKQKEVVIHQQKQQLMYLWFRVLKTRMMENRLEANKNEIAQSEDKHASRFQEYENRVAYYQNLYDEEMKQRQMWKERYERNIQVNDQQKQTIQDLEKTVAQLEQQQEQLKQELEEKEAANAVNEQEYQKLKIAFNNVGKKVIEFG